MLFLSTVYSEELAGLGAKVKHSVSAAISVTAGQKTGCQKTFRISGCSALITQRLFLTGGADAPMT